MLPSTYNSVSAVPSKLYGKVQYIQEKQGFIRCNKKIEKKKDIIFFMDELDANTRNNLHVGCYVSFMIEHNSSQHDYEQCNGNRINYWACNVEIVNSVNQVSSTSNKCNPIKNINKDEIEKKKDIVYQLRESVFISIYKISTVKRLTSCEITSCWGMEAM